MRWRVLVPDIVLKALGLLLLVAGVLKGHELLTVPVANKDLWSWRPFLVFQVEFELALGIWLLSGVLKPLAWWAALSCFGLFCCIALYKGLTGAVSCGCFGQVHVDPWITLLAVDLPAVIALVALRPSFSGGVLTPIPRLRAGMSLALLLGLGVPGGVVMAQARPAKLPANALAIDINTIRSRYVLLDPESWIGKPFPLFEHIDIGDKLRNGRWLVVLHRHDCRGCQEAVPHYKEMAQELLRHKAQLAFVAISPYGADFIREDSLYFVGRLSGAKRWVVMTPVFAILDEGRVVFSSEGEEPQADAVLRQIDHCSQLPQAGEGQPLPRHEEKSETTYARTSSRGIICPLPVDHGISRVPHRPFNMHSSTQRR